MKGHPVIAGGGGGGGVAADHLPACRLYAAFLELPQLTRIIGEMNATLAAKAHLDA